MNNTTNTTWNIMQTREEYGGDGIMLAHPVHGFGQLANVEAVADDIEGGVVSTVRVSIYGQRGLSRDIHKTEIRALQDATGDAGLSVEWEMDGFRLLIQGKGADAAVAAYFGRAVADLYL